MAKTSGKRESQDQGDRLGKKICEQSKSSKDEDEVVQGSQIIQALDGLNELLRDMSATLRRIEQQGQRQGRGVSKHRLATNSGCSPMQPGSWLLIEGPLAEKDREDRRNKETERAESFSDPYPWGQIDPSGHILNEGLGTITKASDFHYQQNGPAWQSCQELLPQLKFEDKIQLGYQTGTYPLVIRYNCTSGSIKSKLGYNAIRYNCTSGSIKSNELHDASIIIGGVDFSCDGTVGAKGADWDRLFNGQKQLQIPYAHGARGERVWMRSKICEPWQDGDLLRFRIDTNEKTIVFQRGDAPERVLWNVLAFSNDSPESLKVYAFCKYMGGCRGMKLTVVNDNAESTVETSTIKKLD